MEERKEPEVLIKPDDLVTVTKMGHITEIQFLEKMNMGATIKKISDSEYLVLSTGEIKKVEKSEFRSQNVGGLYRTFKKLRYLINNNFSGSSNELFITLTYAPDKFGWRPSVSDTKYLSKCFKAFQRRLIRQFGSVDFIRVLEPHQDGHAHYHVLIKFLDHKSIYIKNDLLNSIWSHGFVTVHSLKNVDNIGAYVSAYLTDIELTEKTAWDLINGGDKKVVIEKDGKKYIKGGRVRYYPTGTQIYNKSKGVVEPERLKMKYANAKKITGSAKPAFVTEKIIKTDDFENSVRFEQYNSRKL